MPPGAGEREAPQAPPPTPGWPYRYGQSGSVASKWSTGDGVAKMRKVRLKSGRTHGDKTDHK